MAHKASHENGELFLCEIAGTAAINATYYSYDIAGNVKTLYQQIAGLGTKKLDYEYDLVSGKVNFLAYQHGNNDAFYYKYDYDAENRLTAAWSSISASVDTKGFGSNMEGIDKRLDATYQYYLHGPLARMELGHHNRKVQGLDYAYTLQGWLKGLNGTSGQTSRDMGLDAHGSSNHSSIAKDVLGFALHYYGFEDYKPIGGSSVKPFADAQSASSGFAKLYNGNIGGISLDNPTLGVPQLYTYKYDQLNRLLRTFTYNGLNTSTNTWNVSANQSFREEFTYDANGNIEKLTRNGNTAIGPQLMDKFTYGYHKAGGKLLNNRLRHIKDTAPAENYATDIDNQNDGNYIYDEIGNLIHDAQEGIAIDWNVYGKIKQITKSAGNIAYTYDASGNRVRKNYTPAPNTGEEKATYYVRDAQGNALAVYEKVGTTPLRWKEQQLYGSSRLGKWAPDIEVDNIGGNAVWNTLGKKSYEITNHLGNVLALVNDNVTPAGNGSYQANVISANDYYAFGSQMPGRSFNLGDNYRYGFNGKENDNEVKGEGNQQDYGFRIYDPRIGRFLSVDPLTKDYPYLTSYQFASNSPVSGVDLDGLEYYYAADGSFIGQGANPNSLEVRLGKVTGNTKSGKPIITAIDIKGNLTKQWIVLNQNHNDFKSLAAVLYAEAAGTGKEVAGIYSVLENRAKYENTSVVEQATVAKGVYGAGKTESTKINTEKGSLADRKRSEVFKGLVSGSASEEDFSNGAFYWDGKDFNGAEKVRGGYTQRYKPGFIFTDKSHDLFNQGDNKKPGESNGVKYDYKYKSTAAYGKTTFSKLTEEYRDAQYPGNKKGKEVGKGYEKQ